MNIVCWISLCRRSFCNVATHYMSTLMYLRWSMACFYILIMQWIVSLRSDIRPYHRSHTFLVYQWIVWKRNMESDCQRTTCSILSVHCFGTQLHGSWTYSDVRDVSLVLRSGWFGRPWYRQFNIIDTPQNIGSIMNSLAIPDTIVLPLSHRLSSIIVHLSVASRSLRIVLLSTRNNPLAIAPLPLGPSMNNARATDERTRLYGDLDQWHMLMTFLLSTIYQWNDN